MNKPVIENSDRGITLNKSLAWTIMVGILAAGVFAGGEIAATREQQRSMMDILTDIKEQQEARHAAADTARAQLDARLRAVETTGASDRAEIAGLRRDLGDFRTELREVIQLLRAVK